MKRFSLVQCSGFRGEEVRGRRFFYPASLRGRQDQSSDLLDPMDPEDRIYRMFHTHHRPRLQRRSTAGRLWPNDGTLVERVRGICDFQLPICDWAGRCRSFPNFEL